MILLLSLSLMAQTAQPASSTTIQWVDMCQNQAAQGSGVNFREACACASGLIGGRTTVRQYELLGELVPGMYDPEQMPTIISSLIEQQAYTAEEITVLGQILETIQPDIDRICGPLE